MKHLHLLLLLALPSSVLAQERPWYVPGSRRLELHSLSRDISDTMGLMLGVELPPLEAGTSRAGQVQRVLAATAQAYAALKIPVALTDSTRFMVGNEQFTVRSDLGGRSLALYLECGQDVNGLWAEIYKISMAMVTFLTPGEGNTLEFRTVLVASAVEIPRAQPNTRECRTTQALERRVYDLTLKALANEGFRPVGAP